MENINNSFTPTEDILTLGEYWTVKENKDGNIVATHKLNFDIQQDRDDFCAMIGYPVGMSRTEFDTYLENNPLGIVDITNWSQDKINELCSKCDKDDI